MAKRNKQPKPGAPTPTPTPTNEAPQFPTNPQKEFTTMAKGMPATMKAFFKDNEAGIEILRRLHLENQIGQTVACPTGDPDTCPKCQTLVALKADRTAAIGYLKERNYDTTSVSDV